MATSRAAGPYGKERASARRARRVVVERGEHEEDAGGDDLGNARVHAPTERARRYDLRSCQSMRVLVRAYRGSVRVSLQSIGCCVASVAATGYRATLRTQPQDHRTRGPPGRESWPAEQMSMVLSGTTKLHWNPSGRDLFLKRLNWTVLSTAVVLIALVGAWLIFSTRPSTLAALQTPALAAIAVAFLIYLTLDRLKEMGQRIERVDDRTAKFYQDVTREIRGIAKEATDEALSQSQAKLADVQKRIEKMLNENPWLRETNPNEILNKTRHLEPVFITAKKLAEEGKRELALGLILEALDDPEKRGTPRDYHNLGALASKELHDDLLAERIYDLYLEKTAQPNEDVLADALATSTQAEHFDKARKLESRLAPALDKPPAVGGRSWRSWVFLADYYVAVARASDAEATLQKGLLKAKKPEDRAHILMNLGEFYADAGDVPKAEAHFKTCLKDYPTHVPAAGRYARLLSVHGRVQEAEAVLEKAASLGTLNRSFDGAYGGIHAGLARLRFARGDITEAAEAAMVAVVHGAADECGPVLRLLSQGRPVPIKSASAQAHSTTGSS